MYIELNNEKLTLPHDDMTVKELIEWRGIQHAGVAVAINNKIVSRPTWDSTRLNEGDIVVLISAAYGG
jgi:sulfur carrier protein